MRPQGVVDTAPAISKALRCCHQGIWMWAFSCTAACQLSRRRPGLLGQIMKYLLEIGSEVATAETEKDIEMRNERVRLPNRLGR